MRETSISYISRPNYDYYCVSRGVFSLFNSSHNQQEYNLKVTKWKVFFFGEINSYNFSNRPWKPSFWRRNFHAKGKWKFSFSAINSIEIFLAFINIFHEPVENRFQGLSFSFHFTFSSHFRLKIELFITAKLSSRGSSSWTQPYDMFSSHLVFSFHFLS